MNAERKKAGMLKGSIVEGVGRDRARDGGKYARKSRRDMVLGPAPPTSLNHALPHHTLSYRRLLPLTYPPYLPPLSHPLILLTRTLTSLFVPTIFLLYPSYHPFLRSLPLITVLLFSSLVLFPFFFSHSPLYSSHHCCSSASPPLSPRPCIPAPGLPLLFPCNKPPLSASYPQHPPDKLPSPYTLTYLPPTQPTHPGPQ